MMLTVHSGCKRLFLNLDSGNRMRMLNQDSDDDGTMNDGGAEFER